MKRKAKALSLGFVWAYRLKLRAEGHKLWAEGDKLRAEGDKLWAEGYKLRAEGYKLWAEGDKICAEGHKLWAEGHKLWAEAVLSVHGNITMEWKSPTHCVLGTGEEFTEAALAAGRKP
jgi:hypothetical protein